MVSVVIVVCPGPRLGPPGRRSLPEGYPRCARSRLVGSMPFPPCCCVLIVRCCCRVPGSGRLLQLNPLPPERSHRPAHLLNLLLLVVLCVVCAGVSVVVVLVVVVRACRVVLWVVGYMRVRWQTRCRRSVHQCGWHRHCARRSACCACSCATVLHILLPTSCLLGSVRTMRASGLF